MASMPAGPACRKVAMACVTSAGFPDRATRARSASLLGAASAKNGISIETRKTAAMFVRIRDLLTERCLMGPR